jgi:hypothetical protein
MDSEPIAADTSSPRIAPELWRSAILSIVLQVVAFIITSALLDGGLLLRVSGAAALLYWVWFIALLMRRGRAPRPVDLAFAKLGFAAAWPIVFWARDLLL